MVRPRIAITTDVRVEHRAMAFVYEEYVRRVEEAGGLPFATFPLEDLAAIPALLDGTDGLVIVGGEDLDPRLYGEEPLATHKALPPRRERFDLAFGRAVLASDVPVLGVCYGCQLLAVLSGGALWQHLPDQVGTRVAHGGGRYPDLPMHPVDVLEGTRLRELVGTARLEVNSAHHQAPKRLGPGLRPCALAEDGVLEAFESEDDRFLFGVEWHPELIEGEATRRLFEALVAAAAREGSARSGA